jgi:hypothetical protein
MKKLTMKKTLFAFVSGVLAIAGITSCNLDNNNTTPPVSSFGLVNVSPNAGSIDAFLNGNPIVYNLPYGVDTGYFRVQSGSYTLTIDSAGSPTQLYNDGISFAPATNYSVFVIDSASNLHTAVVVDSVTAPSADSVRFRFLNFSPNTPPVDVALSGTIVSANRAYNDVASNGGLAKFGFVAPGTYTLELRIAGTSTVLLSVPDVVLQGGKIYTLYAKGLVGDTGSGALGLGTVVHNQ